MHRLCPESHTPGTRLVVWHSARTWDLERSPSLFQKNQRGGKSGARPQSRPPPPPADCHQLPFSPTSPLPILGAQRPWPDPGPKLPGFELASGCSQGAHPDRIGYSVSFIYLKPHHRNLVPKNCPLALSEPGSCCVHKHNNDSLLPAGTLWSPLGGPSSADPLGPCAPPLSPGTRRGSLPSAASPRVGTPPHSSWLPRPQVSAPPPALDSTPGFAGALLGLCSSPSRREQGRGAGTFAVPPPQQPGDLHTSSRPLGLNCDLPL